MMWGEWTGKKEMQEKRLNVTKNKARRNKDPDIKGNVQESRENNFLLYKFIFSYRQVKKVRILRWEVANCHVNVRDTFWLRHSADC
jgi:hypothetical protein